MGRLDLGPVFWSELRRISRHWWFYALRSILVGALLLGLGAVTEVGVRRLDLGQVSEMAKVGEWFFVAITLLQLSLVLLAAPAATAGAFCTEMARGHVCLMLVSGINSAQIVFGTLGAGCFTCWGPSLASFPCSASRRLSVGYRRRRWFAWNWLPWELPCWAVPSPWRSRSSRDDSTKRSWPPMHSWPAG